MSTDDVQDVAHVARGSSMARLGRAAFDRLRIASARSAVAKALHSGIAALTSLTLAERVRLAGVVILTATLTQAALLQLSPVIAQPQAPTLLRFEIAVAGIVLAVMAGAIARAWPRSRLRRLIRPCSGTDTSPHGR